MIKETDSIRVYKQQRLRRTCRGRCIVCYARLQDRPCSRVLLFLTFTIFALLHIASFCAILFFCFSVSSHSGHLYNLLSLCVSSQENYQCDMSINMIMLPLFLFTFYPIVLIPILIVYLIKDLIVSGYLFVSLFDNFFIR